MSGEKLTAQLIKVAPKAGLVLALVACAAVGWRLVAQWSEVSPLLMQGRVVVSIGFLSVVYGGSLFLLAITWAILVNPPGNRNIIALVRAYGIASIAKYLPGNVFHLAGRHVTASRLGIPHTTLALATILEVALGVIAAAFVTLCFVLPSKEQLSVGLGMRYLWIPIIAATLVVIVALGSGLSRVYQWRARAITASIPPVRSILKGAFLSAAFFLASGLVAILCAYVITGTAQFGMLVAGAAILSWLIGFLTPGVSGGIGIREAIMLALLSSVIGEAEALSLAIANRVITLIGDLLFLFACQFLIRMRSHSADMEKEEKTL